jgi:hypothetical protein
VSGGIFHALGGQRLGFYWMNLTAGSKIDRTRARFLMIDGAAGK